MLKTSIGWFSSKEFCEKANEGSLPENLEVSETLCLIGTDITSLPKGLHIKGNLDLTSCTTIKTLPEGLNIYGYLGLYECTSLTSLSEGLKVGGNLNLGGCTSLTSLPDGLEVEGSLFLYGCSSLKSLPSDMKIERLLGVHKSFIKDYPFRDIPKILHLPFLEDLKQLLLERLQ
jgi:hypothetical protein